MKIISGDFKGRRLLSPKDLAISPSSGKVKEALFSMLAGHIEDARVLDLFAGSGALGLEALSRGADFCVFVDNNKDSLYTVKHNIRNLSLEDRTRVLNRHYNDALKSLEGDFFDLIILDPPYMEENISEILNRISQKNLLAKNGLVVVEHKFTTKIPDETDFLKLEKSKKYGNTGLAIYCHI